MKKDFLKGILAGCIITASIGGTLALAESFSKQIEAVYNDIKIVVNGEQITPQDGNGNSVDPFISDGTTYLPVRAVASALGQNVEWNGETNTVYLRDSYEDKAIPNYFPVYAHPNDDDSTTISNSFFYNSKLYVPIDEIANALDLGLTYYPGHTSISNRIYFKKHLYGAMGSSPNAYQMIAYFPSDDPNDASAYSFYINTQVLDDADFERYVDQDNDNFIWVYNAPYKSSTTTSNYKTPSTSTQIDNNRNNYEQELNAINAKYDAMIEALRSSYQSTISGGYGSSAATTALAQQIQRYEQQRELEIAELDAKYGY